MQYFSELRGNWRALVAAMVGLSTGGTLTPYIHNIFAPQLIAAFGWSRSTFALTAIGGLIAIIFIPLAGRMADNYGVRRVAAIGILFFPLTFIGYSLMTGSILEYVGLGMAQAVLSATTTATVYSRIVAERFVISRGTALAIVTCGPAAMGAIASPVLSAIVDAYGWRFGYQVLAVFFAVMGVLVLIMLPRSAQKIAAAAQPQRRSAREDYPRIAKTPTFWIIVGGTFLCTIPQVLATLHLKMMLLDTGISSATSAVMVSIFAIGVIIGRICSGIALDRFPAYIVAMVGMGLPSIGLLVLGSGVTTPALLGLGISMIGLANGAEGDVVAFLVVRHFGVSLFSTVLGLMTATITIAITLGAAILSVTLTATESYHAFMLFAGTCAAIGGLSFLKLRRAPIAV